MRLSQLAGWLKRRPLLCCLLVALVPRLAVALFRQTYYAADELFQYIEQAHRLVYHQGVVPWEFQVGMRSWLIPLALAVPMQLAHWLNPAPALGLAFIRATCCFASLTLVWCAVRWGQMAQGSRGAWAAGLLTALWPDLWLMAPHALEDAFAAYAMVPALYLASLYRQTPHSRYLLWSGFLLGLSFVLREQMAPAIAVIGIYLCWGRARNWAFAIGMALLPVLGAGLLDWFTWGQPFRSFWLSPYLNIVAGVAKDFGSAPPLYYFGEFFYAWLWSALLLLFLAWRGARKLPVAGWVALLIIVEHSLITHKEYRFVFPGVALLVPLAGIGLAGAWRPHAGPRNAILLAALLTGAYLSPPFFRLLAWQQHASVFYTKLATYKPCLVAITTVESGFWPVVTVFGAETRFTDATGLDEADAIVAVKGSPHIPAGFTQGACASPSRLPFRRPAPDMCFWTRPHAAVCHKTRAEPYVLVYPPAAKPYAIRDRLTDVP